MCADLLVSSGICASYGEFWESWAGMQSLPQRDDPYICLTMRNIASLNSSIGMQAIIIDDSIDYAKTAEERDQLYREFETLDIAHRLVRLAIQSEFSRN